MDEEVDNPPLALDHRGFIRAEVSLAQVRPPSPAAVEAWRETCRRTFAELLHSLHLTGSVVKGTALASLISLPWQSCRWSQRLSTTQQRAWAKAELRELGRTDLGELFFFAADPGTPGNGSRW